MFLGESENGMTSEKTFSNDELLPPLPLPELKDSLSLYLDSVKPHLTDEEFVKTKQIVDNFEKNEGKILHQSLLDRAKERKNWVNEMIYLYNFRVIMSNFVTFYKQHQSLNIHNV